MFVSMQVSMTLKRQSDIVHPRFQLSVHLHCTTLAFQAVLSKGHFSHYLGKQRLFQAEPSLTTTPSLSIS